MLPRSNRLKKEKDFKRVYRYGKIIRGNFFDLYYLKDDQVIKFGIVAATKAIKKATRRNRTKRIVRSLIVMEKNIWPKGLSIVKIRKEINNADKKRAAIELELMLKKV